MWEDSFSKMNCITDQMEKEIKAILEEFDQLSAGEITRDFEKELRKTNRNTRGKWLTNMANLLNIPIDTPLDELNDDQFDEAERKIEAAKNELFADDPVRKMILYDAEEWRYSFQAIMMDQCVMRYGLLATVLKGDIPSKKAIAESMLLLEASTLD